MSLPHVCAGDFGRLFAKRRDSIAYDEPGWVVEFYPPGALFHAPIPALLTTLVFTQALIDVYQHVALAMAGHFGPASGRYSWRRDPMGLLIVDSEAPNLTTLPTVFWPSERLTNGEDAACLAMVLIEAADVMQERYQVAVR